MAKIYKGRISGVGKETLTHTSGGGVKTDMFGKVKGKEIDTEHKHYTNFILNDETFRCEGDYIFKDNDLLVFTATATNQGFYEVADCKNVTRGFFKKGFSYGEMLLVMTLGVFVSALLAALVVSGIWWALFGSFPFMITFIVSYILIFLLGCFVCITNFKDAKMIKNYPIENLESE